MKKIFLLLTMFVALSAQADEYAYLTFETTDGTKTSVSVSGLTLSVSGTTLTAGGTSFVLTNLSKMYFSNSNVTTSIEQTSVGSPDEAAAYYDLRGQQVDEARATKGVFIVKTKQGTHKIIAK